MIRIINQACLVSICHSISYEYGYQVPCTPEEAIELDKKNGNTKWQDSMALDILQLDEYQTFCDLGKGAKAPPGYKWICCHLVFDVKHDDQHKTQLVAGGHMTNVPLENVYSGVISLRSLQLVIFLAELNSLILFQADVGNAYLEAKTKEQIYFVANAGFGEQEGHTLIIMKA